MKEYSQINANQNNLIRNQGIQILRMVLSFWIVLCHSYHTKNLFWRGIKNLNYHVPTFFVISFYYFYHNLYNRNIYKIKNRLERLLIPYFIWPIIVFLINNIIFILPINKIGRKFVFKDLIVQLIFGMHIHPIFWFQSELIFLTIFYTIIYFILPNYFIFLLEILWIICYSLQYSNLNYDYFIKFKNNYNRYIGSIFEVIPFTITGIILIYVKAIHRIQNEKYKILFFNTVLLYLIIKYKCFIKPKGFRFPGINLNFSALLLFVNFSIIPFEKIENSKIKSFISYITNYSGGIYYLHEIIREYLIEKIFKINKAIYLLRTLAIYLISYFLCMIGIKIFGNSKIKNIFY